ncbi:hypothetical protein D3C71_1810210 [compost metagenome]
MRVAPTATTLAQLAGRKLDALEAELPAATTTVVPRDTAPLIASWYSASHAPPPPRLMLMTSAGLALAGMPATVPPEAHVIASAMSDR